MSCDLMSCDLMSCDLMSCDLVSCDLMSCDLMSCYLQINSMHMGLSVAKVSYFVALVAMLYGTRHKKGNDNRKPTAKS